MVAPSIGLNLVIEDLEKKVAHYAGTRYAVICSSGRSAIRFSLLALGIKRGCEVVIPDLSCQILPITVFCTGATPRFCDIEKHTLALSPRHLPRVLNSNTKAIVFVHPYGMPVDPSPVLEITQKRKIAFIDDAAQALGATIRDKKVGSFGDVGIFTFNKFLDVNSGAAVVTSQQETADRVRSFRERFEKRSLLPSFGYCIARAGEFLGSKSNELMQTVFWTDNYVYGKLNAKFTKKHFEVVDGWVKGDSQLLELHRSKDLPNAQVTQLMGYTGKFYVRRKLEKPEALVLQSEFENVEKSLEKRNKMAKTYEDRLSSEEFSKFVVPKDSSPSYFRYPVLFSEEKKRSTCIANLFRAGFLVDYTYKPLHTSPFFNLGNGNSKFGESTYMSRHLLPLPVSNGLSIGDVEKIISIVNSTPHPY